METTVDAPTVKRPVSVPAQAAVQPATLPVATTAPVAQIANVALTANAPTVEQHPRVPVEIPVRA